MIKPLKSEAIHETGLSGNVVASFFPLIIFIFGIIRRQHSGGDDKKFTATRGGGRGVVIRIVQSPPTHP